MRRTIALVALCCCSAFNLRPPPRTFDISPRIPAIAACAAAESISTPVNISWREESTTAEDVVPSVSLTRSRDGSTGTATFKFERPSVLSLHDVWDNGLVTGLWLQDEEGSLHSPDLSVDFAEGRPSELTAILVLKSPSEWERFMRFMRRYAEANDLAFERSASGDAG